MTDAATTAGNTAAPEASPPRISINLCCYNGEAYLEETLGSIVAQTFTNWELVVIDDGSTDGTGGIVQRYQKSGWPITYHYQKNAGLGAARNKAIALSRAPFIAFIDQDDLWLPEKLERQSPLFDDPEVGLVFCDTIFFNNRGDTQRFYGSARPHTGYCFNRLLSHYALSLETVVIRRTALGDPDNWFDIRFNMIEEADLFRRIGYRWKLAMVDRPLAKWRVHADSWSWRKGYLMVAETDQMLARFKKMIPEFESRYHNEIAILRRNTAKDAAFYLWKQGRGAQGRRLLRPYRTTNRRILLLYVLSAFPADWVLGLQRLFRRQIVTP
ncbi:MAG: glycosyltransferase [Pseudomonadota bacterium]